MSAPIASTVDSDRHIGGESAHRSFFGRTQPKGRIPALAVCFLVMLVATPLIGVWGVVIAAAGGLTTVLLTARTHRGSIIDRRIRRSRWKRRTAAGTDRFDPFDEAEWEVRTSALANARGRKARTAAAREVAAMRAVPDGADGLGWLQLAPREPGIAWHAPSGEPEYLSVAFTVTGQASGLESPSAMRQAAAAWGAFLESKASASNLASSVQTITRVLPPDSAMQEFWVLSALDDAAPADAVQSYEDVLRLTGENAMVQRHYIVLRWQVTEQFRDAALKYGTGRDGWRGLMRQEISSTITGLRDARLGEVEVLSARRLAAMILHQQNPSRPIDYVADIDPTSLGLSSHDEFSAHVVDDSDPVTGETVTWWHRTAAITSENMAMGARTPLWALPLLLGNETRTVRTLSFHLRLIPKGEASSAARADVVRDTADVRAAREKGRLVADETGSNMSAAKRRAADLAHGSPHQGVEWVGFVTISERSRDDLMRGSRILEDACATQLGVTRLDWLDSYQAAASGTTWPIARGLNPGTPSFATRTVNRMAGRSDKDSLS
ncbi:hypothetical protein [Schumannella sp. 10F1B-5-1]|uniref:hypothetical protein n=1 Tax=Schumannella sp. 10F1B-5-1 TaxID=2590780 RepID=UPI0011323669|nr:hypothetical protein [Schumannella sp. 10F1B-5-1]TPW78401.1 hypothetical protein FJ658_00920 [Schumannella sp. 10F1B-5-1]